MKVAFKRIMEKLAPLPSVDFEYPDPNRVLGLSTSHYTGVVDWNKARDNGIRFAYIKAQDGSYNPVKFWNENYEGAKKAGIKVGGYTWLYSSGVISPGNQARTFAEFAKKYECELPWCVDFEWTFSGNPNTGDLWGFVIPFEESFGAKPAIYTAPGYWSQFGSKNPVWNSYPLWEAQYNHGQADVIVPWTKGYKFLQWTEKGKGADYGVPVTGEIACELNYYNGTLGDFESEYGEITIPPVEPPIIVVPPGDIMPTQKGVAKVATNIKSMSGVPSGAVASLPVGGWVLGNYSPTRTDLIDVISYFRPTGEEVKLTVPCKVAVANLTVTPYTDVPPVDPPPVVVPYPDLDVHINILGDVTTVVVNGVTFVQAV